MAVDVAVINERLAAGYHMCGSCHAVSRPDRTDCFQCGCPFGDSPTGVVVNPAAANPPVKPRRRPQQSVTNTSAARSKTALGSLADRPHHALDITAYGLPQTQGSGVAVAAGVYARSGGKELHAWRRTIEKAAKAACGPGWVAPNTALELVIVFTVPTGAKPPTGPEHPDGYRDLDKLIRAVCDALTPTGGFRAVASDMRYSSEIVSKTYPAPHNVHPMALTEPGVWLRIQPPQALTVDPDCWTLRFPFHQQDGASRSAHAPLKGPRNP